MKPAVFFPSEICGTVTVPASKSIVHRQMIAAAMSDAPVTVIGRIEGKDTEATARALVSLGAEVRKTEEGYGILPLSARKRAVAEVGESGSTLRFLLPVAAALGTATEFRTEGRLSERPIKELAEAVAAHGATIGKSGTSFFVEGKLRSGKYSIDGTVSSQYISGLLFALPSLSGDSEVEIKGNAVSGSYIDLTLATLARFGIEIEKTAAGFFIKGGQTFRSPKTVLAEGDWSSAAFFAVAAAVGGKITLKNLDPRSAQGDKAVAEILNKMGAETAFGEDGFTVGRKPLSSVFFDAENCPDLVPVMAVAAACASGESEISGVARLRLKESDRLLAIIENLAACGISASTDGNVLRIRGGRISGGKLRSFGDHRMAMSAAVAGISAAGGIYIDDVNCTAKSYPSFLDDYLTAGGRYELVR